MEEEAFMQLNHKDMKKWYGENEAVLARFKGLGELDRSKEDIYEGEGEEGLESGAPREARKPVGKRR